MASQQQINKMLQQISFSIDKDPAKKLIPLFYIVAKQIKDNLPDNIIKNNKQKQSSDTSGEMFHALDVIHEKFYYFKKTRGQQIKKLNQVDSFMVQQTDEIIKTKASSLIRSSQVDDTQRSQIFLKPQTYYLQEDHIESNEGEFSKRQLEYIAKKYSKIVKVNEKPTSQDCCSIWKNVIKYYQDHRIDQAYAQVQRFQSYLYLNDRGKKLKQQHIDLIQTISLEYKTMTQFYQNFNQKGYTFDKEDNGIKCWFKIIGQRNVAIRIQAEVQIPIDHFLSIATQIDLFQQYIPFTYDTKQLKTLSRNQRIGTSKVYIPLLTDRQTFFYAAAYNRLKTKGSIFFYSKTINQDKFYQKKYGFEVPQKSDLIRLDYNFYLIEYFPLTKTRGKVRLATSIDLKMDYLPMFVINKSARVFSFDYFKNMIRMNKKFKGSKWQKKIIQKKQLYNFFREKINQYMDEFDHLNGQKILPSPPTDD